MMLAHRKKKRDSLFYDLEDQQHHHSPCAAFFDLDKTILAGDSQGLEAVSLLKQQRGWFAVLYGLRLLKVIISDFLAKWNLMDAERANRICLYSYRGMSFKTLEKNSEALHGSTFRQLMYPEMMNLIEDHRQKGHYVVLVSASTEHLVKPFATNHRSLVDSWKATRLQIDPDGVCTGLPEGQVVLGQNKASIVETFLAEHNIRPENSYAYSDHHADIPFLESVGNPTVVNPTKKLDLIAKERKWPVMRCVSTLPSQGGAEESKKKTPSMPQQWLFLITVYLSVQIMLALSPEFSIQLVYVVVATMRILWDILPIRLAACLSLWPIGRRSKVWLSALIVLMCGLHLVRPDQVSISPERVDKYEGTRLPYAVVIADKKRLPSFFENVHDVGLGPQNVHHQDAVHNRSKKGGIWEAFRQAFLEAEKTDNVTAVLTLEDDVELYQGWTKALSAGMDALEKDQCDAFLLGGFNLVEEAPVNGVDGVYRGLGVCTEATLFSRTAMQSIIDMDDESQPLEIDDWMRRNLRTCYYEWPAAGQNSLPNPNTDSFSTWGEYCYLLARNIFPFSKLQAHILTTGRIMSMLFGKPRVVRSIQSFLPS